MTVANFTKNGIECCWLYKARNWLVLTLQSKGLTGADFTKHGIDCCWLYKPRSWLLLTLQNTELAVADFTKHWIGCCWLYKAQNWLLLTLQSMELAVADFTKHGIDCCWLYKARNCSGTRRVTPTSIQIIKFKNKLSSRLLFAWAVLKHGPDLEKYLRKHALHKTGAL